MSMGLRSKAWSCAIVITMLAVPSLASAKDNTSWAPNSGIELLQLDEGDTKGSVMLYARFSAIDGEADPNVPVDYSDIFGTGVGFQLEGSMLWKSGDWLLGGYISIGSDTFNGEKDTDAVGDSLEPDDMDITTFLVGFKGLMPFGSGFYWDVHIGIGIANYSSVDGTLILSGIPFDVEVFGSTGAFAFDFGTRIGYSVGHFTADLGFGFRFQGPPDGGDLDLDTSLPVMAAFEIGAGVTF